ELKEREIDSGVMGIKVDTDKGELSGTPHTTQIGERPILDSGMHIPKGKHSGKYKKGDIYDIQIVGYVDDPTKIIRVRLKINLEPKDLYGWDLMDLEMETMCTWKKLSWIM
ncbi:hypothetical protein KI387_016542, partial [Taxus chinensis]